MFVCVCVCVCVCVYAETTSLPLCHMEGEVIIINICNEHNKPAAHMGQYTFIAVQPISIYVIFRLHIY